jgi:hypothetical protein
MNRSIQASRRLALTAMALALTAGLMAALPSQAMAATSTAIPHVVPMLSGTGYDGTDPQATGCAASAELAPGTIVQPIFHGTTKVGTVELRYSTSCHTAWARVYYVGSYYGSSSWVGTGIHRASGSPMPKNYDYFDGSCNTFCHDYVSSGTGSYGYQIYDGSGYSAYAMGYICASDSTCQTTWNSGRTGTW